MDLWKNPYHYIDYEQQYLLYSITIKLLNIKPVPLLDSNLVYIPQVLKLEMMPWALLATY